MPDNWSFVAAAYGLTALVLGIYWRRLVRKERELNTLKKTGSARSVAGSPTSVAGRSQEPSGTGHPRNEPASPTPLQQNPRSGAPRS
jgi:hypothetical protein